MRVRYNRSGFAAQLPDHDCTRSRFGKGATRRLRGSCRACLLRWHTRHGQFLPLESFAHCFGSARLLLQAIALRTLVVKDGVAYLQAGGGIVFDSDPQAEYEETMHKMRALAVYATALPRFGCVSKRLRCCAAQSIARKPRR